MSKASDALRAINVHNPHNAASVARRLGGVGVYVTYHPAMTGRGYKAPGWVVIDTTPGAKTDPNGHWRDYGNKTFDVYGRAQKERQCNAALNWASEKYPAIKAWEKVPGLPGAFFPAQDAALIKTALKEGTPA